MFIPQTDTKHNHVIELYNIISFLLLPHLKRFITHERIHVHIYNYTNQSGD